MSSESKGVTISGLSDFDSDDQDKDTGENEEIDDLFQQDPLIAQEFDKNFHDDTPLPFCFLAKASSTTAGAKLEISAPNDPISLTKLEERN